MATLKRNSSWLMALAVTAALAASAATLTQNLLADKQPAVATQPVLKTPHVSDARDLSSVFRDVAKAAMPAVVSIETRGKLVKIDATEGANPFGENSPFGDFFKNDPRFKDLFKNQPREMPRSRGMGSGFIVDKSGIILTNNHVVAEADQVKVKLSDGREYLATDIKTDPRSDVAIVRIEASEDLPVVPMGNSDIMDIGDWVLAVGSPFGLDMSVTAGIISAKSRGPGITDREDFLQTDAAINPGNSGGPLLNLNGEVIGINTAISSRSGGYEGIGFAIPINMANWVSRQLIESGSVRRGFLGVGIQPVDNQLAEQFHIQVGQGAIVSQVMPDSPAAAANLEPGDVILKLDGKKVSDPRNLQGIVERLDIGSSYKLEVLRNGKPIELSIKVKEMPGKMMAAVTSEEEPEEAKPEANSVEELGMEIQELTPDLAKQLGYQDGTTGVVISNVTPDQPASNSGLRGGMVVERVGSVDVSTVEEFQAALKKLKLDDGILMLIRTPRGTQFVVVKREA